MNTISELWMWLSFLAFMGIMIAVDILLLGGKRAHRISSKEALGWVIIWNTLALSFNGLLWFYLLQTHSQEFANTKALEFLTGYLIEFSLSIDNMFIFLMIFNYFSIPHEYQHRVLIYGVLSAIILRLLMITVGIWLVVKFHWILYIFGAFLIFTGIKMLMLANVKTDIEKNPILLWINKHLTVTHHFYKEKFFIIQNNKITFTPLFVALILIELSDVIFAIDSIPAIFSVTKDPFIVFTSNIFAILGLRSLYFLLAKVAERFHLVKYGIAIILIFIGLKMLLENWLNIPISYALGFIACVLLTCVLLSLLLNKSQKT